VGSAVFVEVEGAASLPEGAAWERAGTAAGAAMSTSNLTVIESARISSIIEEALEKLSFLASITPDVMAHRDELSQIVGDEITRIIQEQRGLELRYEELIAQRSSLKALSNKAKYKENQELIKEVARALRESTKELCRNLKGNPNIAENLSKIQTERSNLQNLLSKTLRELRETSFSTLTTTVEEEKARNDMILEVIAKEKEVSASVKKLQEDLSSERHQHEAEVEERNEIISKLKEELQEVRTKSAIETKYLQKESRARLQSLNRIYGQSTSELDEQIWKVRKQLEIEVLANRESEEFLKRKVVSLQKDAGDWMQRYETDFEELEKEHETLNAQRTEDLVKLNDYTERYTKEMEEKARREEEARIREEMEALRKQEEERNTWAATTVQKLWRGHLARTGGGGKKGKKGKKGKGGKGGKKKK
jgi:IQ domain-containing protein G